MHGKGRRQRQGLRTRLRTEPSSGWLSHVGCGRREREMRFRFCACALNRQGIPTVCHTRVPTVAHPGGNTWESSQLIVKYIFLTPQAGAAKSLTPGRRFPHSCQSRPLNLFALRANDLGLYLSVWGPLGRYAPIPNIKLEKSCKCSFLPPGKRTLCRNDDVVPRSCAASSAADFSSRPGLQKLPDVLILVDASTKTILARNYSFRSNRPQTLIKPQIMREAPVALREAHGPNLQKRVSVKRSYGVCDWDWDWDWDWVGGGVGRTHTHRCRAASIRSGKF